MIDFTNCKRVLSKAYSGANGKKIAVIYAGEQYMLKFPPSGKEKPTELSYTNSCICEHIGSSIFNMIGIPAQKTLLGSFDVDGKTKVVCACKDFTADGKLFYDFCSIKNTVIDSEHGGTGTELDDITETIEKQQFIDPVTLSRHFWRMFVVDSLIGNFDRHNGNWGFLVDPVTQKASIAPIFDCGSSLLPQADDGVMERVLESEDELNARIYRFPTSAIKQNGRKINYYDFMTSNQDPDYCDAVREIMPKINIVQICDLIDNVPCISDLQKDFYKTYVEERYQKILEPAYTFVMEQTNREEP